MADVLNVAEYVLEKIGETTTLKLQKLVYYCQAWSLAWDGDKLFDDDFEAWANGPVCKRLFDIHKGEFTISPDKLSDYKYDKFTEDQIETMDNVIGYYNKYTPQELSDLTHKERPWRESRRDCRPGDKCSNIIPKETMQDYYAGLEDNGQE